MPFLFMGVFPPDYEASPSKIMNMFTAEGWFLDTDIKRCFEDYVWICLQELCSIKHLLLFNRRSLYWNKRILHGPMYKSCRLHSSWRHVCRGEAKKSKFYQVLSKLVDGLEECVKGQRCLSFENNMLLGIKEFCNSLTLSCASSTRSLLFLGPYHQYPVPIDASFRLLGELDALTLRFYTFPTQILMLVQLKYLALTCNGKVPITISKLFKLGVLIIRPHINIKTSRAPPYIPVQIWDMHELEHIEVLGKSLVAPYHVASLEKLSTLVGVSSSIFTIPEVFKKLPRIRKLGVQIELTPYDDHNDLLSCFGCISMLERLETLKCSIVNHVVKQGYVVPAIPKPLMLPRMLQKLHLSGTGYPWQYVDAIGSLPHLSVLKLRSYAFRGSLWKAQRNSFLMLEFLLVEDSDLVQWKPRAGSFPYLGYLSMKHCYKLKEIHWPSRSDYGKIELVDCNPLAVTCAKQLQPYPRTRIDVTASTSFDGKPMIVEFARYGPR